MECRNGDKEEERAMISRQRRHEMLLGEPDRKRKLTGWEERKKRKIRSYCPRKMPSRIFECFFVGVEQVHR